MKDKKTLAVAAIIGFGLWTWQKGMIANASTQEFKAVPKPEFEKTDRLGRTVIKVLPEGTETRVVVKPNPAEVIAYKTNPDAWVEDKIKEIEAAGAHVVVSPTTKASLIEESRGRLAPETIDWQTVANNRAAEGSYGAIPLQQAINQGASTEVLNVVARTNRTDIAAIQREFETGIPPRPPQSVVDAMIAKGEALPSWYVEHYM